jgi:hypothetical protein
MAEFTQQTETKPSTDAAGMMGPIESSTEENTSHATNPNIEIRFSSPERIQLCNLEGLEIAELVLKRNMSTTGTNFASSTTWNNRSGGGGSFGQYTVGLVGKPSAGK